MGAITGEKRFHDNGVARVIQFTSLLRDPANGLFHQAWGFKETEREDGYTPGYWGRGNGWIVAAEVETLAFLPKDHPKYEEVLGLFRELCAALAKHQDEEGLWHNLIDKPDSQKETSATGLITFAYAKGVRLGLLDLEYRERARKGFEGLRRHVRPNGTVLNTCRGTGPRIIKTLQDYYERPHPPNDPHGNGPVLLAASEMIRLEQTKK